jgi:hypothetical protein
MPKHRSLPAILAAIAFVLAACALPAPATATRTSSRTTARMPALPAGAQTRWVVKGPEEIVAYAAFDPATVAERLPADLRFVTVGELAAGGARWAADHLAEHPAQGGWGISFVEIVRAGTFSIDGRSPRWPKHGAAALWFARVAPADSSTDLGFGRPLLVLDLWLPDSAYVTFMRSRGHHATYGDVSLARTPGGRWRGSIDVPGLHVDADCLPVGPVAGGALSAGSQALFPPRTSGLDRVVRIAFAGHRERECGRDAEWTLRGSHPLACSVVLQPTLYEYGYEMVGGAYRR